MSQSIQVSVLRERVRQLCDLPDFDTESTVTAAAVLDFLQTSLAELGAIIAEYTDEQLLTTSGTVTTAASVATVALPTSTHNVMRIAWVRSATEQLPLEWADVGEWNPNDPCPWSDYGPIKYRLMGPSSIELFPTPNAAYTLKLHYNTGIYVTAISDTVVMRPGWDNWVVFNACGLVRMRQQKTAEDMGPGSFFMQRDQTELRIRKQLKRDHYGPKHARDTRSTAMFGADPYARRRY